LRVFPISGKDLGSSALVRYRTDEIDLSRISSTDYWFIMRWAFAETQQILAQIRTKYAEWPSATGSITMNGDTLFTNGEALKSDLDEKIRSMREPLPIITG